MNKKAFLFFGFLVVFASVGFGLVLTGPKQETGTANVSLFSEPSGTASTPSVLSPPAAQVPTGESALVKRTVDGDTIDVIIGGKEEKVRLLGINSPESVDPRRAVECYGKEASKRMDLLATGHTVVLVSDATNDDRDTYRRLLRYVYLEDGTFVNSWMVEHGYAFAYTKYPFVFTKKFVELERIARSQEVGLWNSAVCPYYTNK